MTLENLVVFYWLPDRILTDIGNNNEGGKEHPSFPVVVGQVGFEDPRKVL